MPTIPTSGRRRSRWDTSSIRFCVLEGVRTACGPEMYDPEKGSFYHNEGGGRGGGPVRFVEATARFGLAVIDKMRQ